MNKTIQKRIKENKDKPRFEDIFNNLVSAYIDRGGKPLDLTEGTEDRKLFENMTYIIWEKGMTKELIDHVWNKTWIEKSI